MSGWQRELLWLLASASMFGAAAACFHFAADVLGRGLSAAACAVSTALSLGALGAAAYVLAAAP